MNWYYYTNMITLSYNLVLNGSKNIFGYNFHIFLNENKFIASFFLQKMCYMMVLKQKLFSQKSIIFVNSSCHGLILKIILLVFLLLLSKQSTTLFY